VKIDIHHPAIQEALSVREFLCGAVGLPADSIRLYHLDGIGVCMTVSGNGKKVAVQTDRMRTAMTPEEIEKLGDIWQAAQITHDGLTFLEQRKIHDASDMRRNVNNMLAKLKEAGIEIPDTKLAVAIGRMIQRQQPAVRVSRRRPVQRVGAAVHRGRSAPRRRP
jgi:hypothetical protein